jgi:hypothetical protein
MGVVGRAGRWSTLSRWSLLRQGLRVVLGVLALIWTMVTVAWLKLDHPLNASVTALVVVADLLWVVRTGHAATGAEADEAWSRRALPVGAAVLVFSLAGLSPSRSHTPSGAIVGLSFVLWSCVCLAVWLTGTPARSAARPGHPTGPGRDRGQPPRRSTY